jgi:hypothetical protein
MPPKCSAGCGFLESGGVRIEGPANEGVRGEMGDDCHSIAASSILSSLKLARELESLKPLPNGLSPSLALRAIEFARSLLCPFKTTSLDVFLPSSLAIPLLFVGAVFADDGWSPGSELSRPILAVSSLECRLCCDPFNVGVLLLLLEDAARCLDIRMIGA